MKKIIILLLMMVLLFTGCNVSSEEEAYCDNFICVEHDSVYSIYVDKNTMVMYWSKRNSGITVILNADGTPMLWDGELEE